MPPDRRRRIGLRAVYGVPVQTITATHHGLGLTCMPSRRAGQLPIICDRGRLEEKIFPCQDELAREGSDTKTVGDNEPAG